MICNGNQSDAIQNNIRLYKCSNFYSNNINIQSRTNEIRSDNNNNYQEITEFKSQENLICLKK